MTEVLDEALKQGAEPTGWNEVKIEFIQFTTPGDSVMGRLTAKNFVTIRGNRVGKYELIKDNVKTCTFLGSVHLDELLARVGVGREVFIQFTHIEKPTDASGNELKRFKVLVKPIPGGDNR